MQDSPANEEAPQQPQQVVVEENNVGDYNEPYRGYDDVTLTDWVAKLSDIVAYENNRRSKRILQAADALHNNLLHTIYQAITVKSSFELILAGHGRISASQEVVRTFFLRTRQSI